MMPAETTTFNEQMDGFLLTLYTNGIQYSEVVRDVKKRYILAVLKECNWNQCKAARALGMHRNTLSRTCDDLAICPQQSKMAEKKPAQAERQYRVIRTHDVQARA